MNFNICRNEVNRVRSWATTRFRGREMSTVNLYGEDSEFHVKYEPREILGRWLFQLALHSRSASYNYICLHASVLPSLICSALLPYRGLSSTVRRCVSRETGQEFAVKIIDKSQDAAVQESIMAEVDILSRLPQHPNISERRLTVFPWQLGPKCPSEAQVFVRCGLSSRLMLRLMEC